MTTSSPPKPGASQHPSIAIIGAGFSGAALALELLAAAKRPAPQIYIVDKSGRFGPGLAYATSYPGHLMNVPAGQLSARPDMPGDFTDWLGARLRQSPTPARFAERRAYGDYLEVQLRRAAHACAAGAFNFVREAAVAVKPHPGGVDIVLDSGAVLSTNAAVLALGNQPPKAPAGLDDPDVAPYLIDPWSAEFADIPSDADVLLVGTGLTMVDAVLRMGLAPRTGKMFALSRHGLLPQRHTQSEQRDDRPFWVEGSLSQMLREFRAEIVAAMARGVAWQTVFDRFRPETVDTWMSLPLVEKRRFLRHLRPYWDTHRHRTPPHVHAWISALADTEALTVQSGRITRAVRDQSGFDVVYRTRGAREETHLRASYIVNCTGPCADLSQSPDPLIAQILSDGLGRAHSTGLGFDVSVSGRLINTAGAAQPRLFTLGPLTQGAFWEATAVPEIRANADALAETILSAIQRPQRSAKSERETASARAAYAWRDADHALAPPP
jgi:uncharacterized NAD(P)/FAD-binding protein YdhS